MSDYRDYKTTVTRPFHIQTRTATDEYRENFDKIDWSKKQDKAPEEPKKEERR